MRIFSLTVQDFKRVVVAAITPDRRVVQITGANDSGKSTILDAIVCAIGGSRNAPSEPIRAGGHRAVITADLGDYIVTRRFTPSGTVLEVANRDGSVHKKPQLVLDGIFGALSFDPLAFSRIPPKEQFERLRDVVKVDADLPALDAAIARAYTERTEVNREVKRLTEYAATLAVGLDHDADTEPVDVGPMMDQLQAASDHNAAIVYEVSRRARAVTEANAIETEITDLEEQITRLRQRQHALRNTLTVQLHAIEEQPPLAEPIDVALLRTAIDDATRENAARAQVAQKLADHKRTLDALQAVKSTAENLTNLIAEHETTKREAIAAANMPIAGLSFGAGEVLTYNGHPLAQASSAQQLRVAVAIGMALNPKLRVLTIKDGSLLDESSLALLEEMAEEHDFQVWLERVDTSASVGITMVDGSVYAVDGVPVEDLDVAAVA